MSLARLCSRLAKVEAQWRPWVVADVLRRVWQCAPSELGAFLVDVLTSVDKVTATAIMAQLPDTALEALIGPEASRLMHTLNPTTPLSLALCFSALTMGKIRLVIAPLDPCLLYTSDAADE